MMRCLLSPKLMTDALLKKCNKIQFINKFKPVEKFNSMKIFRKISYIKLKMRKSLQECKNAEIKDVASVTKHLYYPNVGMFS